MRETVGLTGKVLLIILEAGKGGDCNYGMTYEEGQTLLFKFYTIININKANIRRILAMLTVGEGMYS